MTRRSLEVHDHSKSGSGGKDINPDSIGKQTPAESISTERLHTTRESPIVIGSGGIRSDFDGADADQRLSNAIDYMSMDDTVILEKADYEQSRTIDTRIRVIGQSGFRFANTRIASDWTLNSPITLKNVGVLNATIELTDRRSLFVNIHAGGSTGELIIQGESSLLMGGRNWGANGVTLHSTASACIIDDWIGGGITDNGSNNTIGDTA